MVKANSATQTAESLAASLAESASRRPRKALLAIGVLAAMIILSLVVFSLGQTRIERVYKDMPIGATEAQVHAYLGLLFTVEPCELDDMPEAWRNRSLERPESTAARCRFLGLPCWEIDVLYDSDGRSYLKVPVFE